MNPFLMHISGVANGACGTLGARPAAQPGTHSGPGKIACNDVNESEPFLPGRRCADCGSGRLRPTDARGEMRLARAMGGMDIAFHTAALRHAIRHAGLERTVAWFLSQEKP